MNKWIIIYYNKNGIKVKQNSLLLLHNHYWLHFSPGFISIINKHEPNRFREGLMFLIDR